MDYNPSLVLPGPVGLNLWPAAAQRDPSLDWVGISSNRAYRREKFLPEGM